MQQNNWPIKLPSFDFTGKTAVITGGTKGIGYAAAMAFARYGANVAVSSRNQADCARAAEEIQNLGGQAAGFQADVSDVPQAEALIAQACQHFGSVDILVNSAGIAVTKKLLDLEEADYDNVMNTNVKGLLFASKAAASVMRGQPAGGRIIQVASVSGLKGSNGMSVYGASKAAVIDLTKTMAIEWSRYGISINAVCPGYVETNINRDVFANPQYREKTIRSIPQRRLGTVDEVASLILYLASDLAYMITGESVVADMGSICG